MTTKTSLGRRICVIGTSGAGKTHVAKAIASKLGYRYVSNDALIWGPNWYEVPREERVPIFAAALDGNNWAIDGNIGSGPEDALMLELCDTLVWLDLPRREVFSQLVWRTLRRSITREKLWHDNVEQPWRILSPRDSVVLWAIRSYARRRRNYTALFADGRSAGKTLVHLRDRRGVNDWLASL